MTQNAGAEGKLRHEGGGHLLRRWILQVALFQHQAVTPGRRANAPGRGSSARRSSCDIRRNVLDVGRLDDLAVLLAEDLDRVVVVADGARW